MKEQLEGLIWERRGGLNTEEKYLETKFAGSLGQSAYHQGDEVKKKLEEFSLNSLYIFRSSMR